VKVTAALAVMALSAGIMTTSEAQEVSQSFAGETTVNVIEVPVRVVDSATGRSVTGLTAADFRILESGAEQRITNFSEISGHVVAAADGGIEPSSEIRQPVRKPVEVVYFFDLYLMYKSDRDRALDAVQERYRNTTPDSENVSVVVFDGQLETLLDRGDHRDDILDALEEVRYVTARGPHQSIAFTEALTTEQVSGARNTDFYERQNRSREYVYELERKITQVGNALSATMARYARAEGRKVLVAFTPGYPRTDWSPSYSPVDYVNASVEYPTEDIWRDVALEAANLGFTLYAVDSSGARIGGGADQSLVADAGFNRMGRDEGRAPQSNPDSTFAIGVSGDNDPVLASIDPNAPNSIGSWIERNRKDLLISSSQATGGNAFFVGQVETALLEVADSLDHYYSLAYSADHNGDGKTYRIEVQMPNHPSYRLIHRAAYVDQPASARSAQRMRSEMLFGGDANPLAVRVEVGEPDSRLRIGAAGSKRVKLPIVLKIPFARLEMIPRGDLYWGKVNITFFGQDQSGNQSRLASFEQPITVSSDQYQEAVAKGYFAYETVIEVEGGAQNVYIGVEDTISGRTTIMPQEFAF
jgi:VWFA-related protein